MNLNLIFATTLNERERERDMLFLLIVKTHNMQSDQSIKATRHSEKPSSWPPYKVCQYILFSS